MSLKEYSISELYRELLLREEADTIKTPYDIIKHTKEYIGVDKEHCLVCILDGAYKVKKVIEVSKGTANQTLMHPREVFHTAIENNAVDIVVVHNHPSGRLVPSSDDDAVTKRLVEAGKIIGIQVIDHVIIGNDTRYYSYLEHEKI